MVEFESLKMLVERVFQSPPEHSNRSLTSHLLGVAAILDDWACSDDDVLAGAFHSAYGTSTYHYAYFARDRRDILIDQIGPGPEKLVHLYCRCDRTRLLQEVGRFMGTERFPVWESSDDIFVAGSEISSILSIMLADLIEQFIYRDQSSAAEPFHLRHESLRCWSELTTFMSRPEPGRRALSALQAVLGNQHETL